MHNSEWTLLYRDYSLLVSCLTLGNSTRVGLFQELNGDSACI